MPAGRCRIVVRAMQPNLGERASVNGVCERGAILIPPPMVHVWIVDTRCGRFPGVDEHGLMCHDEHEGEPAHPDEHG